MNTRRSVIGIVLVLVGAVVYIASADKGGHPHRRPTPTPTPPPPPPPHVTLAWDASDSTAMGYYFKLGFTPGGENQVIDVGNVLTYTVQLTSGTTYYFVVTAYNQDRLESGPSNEVQYIAP